MSGRMTILQVNAQDVGGGAEHVASGLLQGYRQRGLDAYLAVGRKLQDRPDVLELSTGEGHGRAYRAWRHVGDKFGGLRRVLDEWRGIESFHYPATYRLPTLAPNKPDIIHAHNLHGGFFDLRALPWLSRQAPLVLTLHDAWLLSGHCSHSFGCERWRTGCGSCPDLSIYPAVRRDKTAHNWKRKQSLYARCRLYVATPCRWLMDRIRQSMLWPAVVESRVIPNGVDLNVFHPGQRANARSALGIPADAKVVLCAASGMQQNQFKDFETMRAAVASIDLQQDGDVHLIVLGGRGAIEHSGTATIRYVPFTTDQSTVASYYRAADVYIHAARAETFPMTILEALASGLPVVATAVGGIQEQIKSLSCHGAKQPWRPYSEAEATGVLVPRGDTRGMSQATAMLLESDKLRRRLSCNAAHDARIQFDLNIQCETYLAWYASILGNR